VDSERQGYQGEIVMLKSIVATIVATVGLLAQGPGRGIPGLTDPQSAVLARTNADLAPQLQSLNAARSEVIAAAFTVPRDDRAMRTKAEGVRDAEITLANACAVAFAHIQTTPERLSAQQAATLIATGAGRGGGRAGSARGTIPNIREAQIAALTRMSTDLMPLIRNLTAARSAMVAAAFAEPADAPAIRSKAEAVMASELAVANARADAFQRIQSSANKLAPAQLAGFLGMGGTFAGVAFTQPDPYNFNDHAGYVSLFDGVSLKGWDGNPKFWRVEGGAIVGESTPQNPSGNSYIAYRNMVAKDFTLKFEIKIEGTGGSGLQYRSKTGVPWLANIPDNVTANVGPVNLAWMMTGPQADFWPSSRDYTGQFYSENTPMRIQAWRGQVVEGAGLARKELMGNIGDREALGRLVKMNDWNEYIVIARGGTLIQIVNGQLMAVMVDDDPESSNNQPGIFGIEIEATTKVSVRNIWVKKLN
jgi:hypothetical protein